MVTGVIVTHGSLATALLESAEGIVGPLEHVRAVCLGPADGLSLCMSRVHQAIDEVDQGDGVLILADLPGGTPTNVGLQCLADRQVEVITGVNLTMVVKLASVLSAGSDLHTAAEKIANSGLASVRIATDKVKAVCAR